MKATYSRWFTEPATLTALRFIISEQLMQFMKAVEYVEILIAGK